MVVFNPYNTIRDFTNVAELDIFKTYRCCRKESTANYRALCTHQSTWIYVDRTTTANDLCQMKNANYLYLLYHINP